MPPDRFVILLFLLLSLAAGEGATQALDAKTISRIVGVAATTSADGVVRVGWPRTDVEFRVDGLAFRPAMGLGTWAAFQATPQGARVMHTGSGNSFTQAGKFRQP